MYRLVLLIRRQLLREALESLLSVQPDMCVVGHNVLEPVRPHGEDSAVDCYIACYNRDTALESWCGEIRSFRRVLVVSGNLSYEDLLQIRSVASAVVPDTARTAAFVDAIRAVAAGKTWRDVVMLDGSAALAQTPVRLSLTRRQRLVLHHLYEGNSNKEIAAALSVSYPSVKATIQQLFLKVGVRNRAQLVRTAIERLGLPAVSGPEPFPVSQSLPADGAKRSYA